MHGTDFNNQPDTLNVHDEFPTIMFGPHIDNKKRLNFSFLCDSKNT
jgi:hypothetical protein